MSLAILLDTQPTDIWHDPLFQFGTNVAITVLAIVVSSFVSIWIYRRQRSKKEISYQIISDAPVISVDQKIAPQVEIKLDGKVVKDVTLAVIKVWNSGNMAVKRDDYDEPIKFEFKGRTVMSSEVLETEPKDLMDSTLFKTFIPSPQQAQEYVELPPYLLNPKQSVTFSVLLDGAKGITKKRGRIVDGTIVLFDAARTSRYNFFIILILFALSTTFITVAIITIISSFTSIAIPIFAAAAIICSFIALTIINKMRQ